MYIRLSTSIADETNNVSHGLVVLSTSAFILGYIDFNSGHW